MAPFGETLSHSTQAQSVVLLNQQLAAAIDLRDQLRNATWNMREQDFCDTEKLFNGITVEVEKYADLLARRLAALGGSVNNATQLALEHTKIAPYELGITDEYRHLFAVSWELAAFGQWARDASCRASAQGDTRTGDLFRTISRSVDQHLWAAAAVARQVTPAPRGMRMPARTPANHATAAA